MSVVIQTLRHSCKGLEQEAFEHVRGPILWHIDALDMIGQSNPNRVPLEERLDNENYRDGLRWAYVDEAA